MHSGNHTIRPYNRLATGAGAVRSVFAVLAVLCAFLVFFGVPESRCETDAASEYQVKAAYLYNFAKFADWPSEHSGAAAPLTICILGKSPFGDSLASIAGKSVRGRRVLVTYISRVEDLKECDILFICASEKSRLSQTLAVVASRPILTVSDIKRFTASGGMIGFVVSNDKIRFEINQRSVHRSNLRLSAQLLKLATMVSE